MNRPLFPPDQVTALGEWILSLRLDHPVRVAVDGVDAAGKSTLADELAAALAPAGRQVIRASIDGFHCPRAQRYRRGPDSPEGYFHDSFDLDAVITGLLAPLGPGGDRRYRLAAFDFRTDRPIESPEQVAEPDAVLLFDGVFLLRTAHTAPISGLLPYWDFKIFIDAPFEVTLARALRRDRALFGDEAEVRRRYEVRYIPAQKHYLETCHPQEQADVVIESNNGYT